MRLIVGQVANLPHAISLSGPFGAHSFYPLFRGKAYLPRIRTIYFCQYYLTNMSNVLLLWPAGQLKARCGVGTLAGRKRRIAQTAAAAYRL